MTAPREPSKVPSVDESILPKGQCRYILLVPGSKGQRCSCSHFSLNHSTPGADCDCGHLACYHVQDPESSQDKREIQVLKQRLQALEDHVDRGNLGGLGGLVTRVSGLEELLDKSRDEMVSEIRGTYRGISRVWQSVEQLEQRSAHLHAVFSRAESDIASLRNRQLELFDADLSLEERMDRIETDMAGSPTPSREALPPTPQRYTRHATGHTAGTHYIGIATRYGGPDSTPPTSRHGEHQCHPSPVPVTLDQLASIQTRHSSVSPKDACNSWVVHISLLPTYSQPFPFERNTNAYKRCLSRGLHRTVVIADTTGGSFEYAVSKAFETVLKGRPWMPLKAKLCDANELRGLPMLRPLEARLAGGPYDIGFLREHCAVCDASGNVESLYISMCYDTLSWSFLRNSPVTVPGLERCWAHDCYLDSSDPSKKEQDDDVHRRSAGDLVLSLPSLKRTASDASRSSSFGSNAAVATTSGGGDVEVSRNKIQRTCLTGVLDPNRRLGTV